MEKSTLDCFVVDVAVSFADAGGNGKVATYHLVASPVGQSDVFERCRRRLCRHIRRHQPNIVALIKTGGHSCAQPADRLQKSHSSLESVCVGLALQRPSMTAPRLCQRDRPRDAKPYPVSCHQISSSLGPVCPARSLSSALVELACLAIGHLEVSLS